MAMEVVSAEDIKELGKTNIDDILSGMSNTIVEKSQEGYRITIRGMSDSSDAFKGQSMAPPAVAINMDGVYSNRKDTGAGLFDVERVEVLYGPQSTLYSSNSPGGIVNVVTANPKINRYEASGLLEYGSYNLLHTEGAMNAPISQNIALRASFSTIKRDGYLSNGNDDEDQKAARLRALWQPNDKLSFVLTGETTRDGGVGFGSGVKAFDKQDGQWYDPTGRGTGEYMPVGKVTDPWIGNDSEKTTANAQLAKKIYAQINWDTSAGAVSVTPSYTKRNGTSSFVFDDPGTGPETSHMLRQATEKGFELRMTSASDFMFKWIAGFTYYYSFDRGFDRSETFLNSGPTVINGVTYAHWGRMSDRQITNENKAFFLNITYPVSEAFRVTGGFRKSYDEMSTVNEEIRGGPGQPGLSHMTEYMFMKSPNKPDYKLGVEYDLGSNSMIYADYATSYRVQGMGGGGPPPGEGVTETRTVVNVNPETLAAYTLGAKNRFFDNKLQVNAAAYYYDYKNFPARGGNEFEVWAFDWNNNGFPDPGRDANEVVGQRSINASNGNGRVIGLDLSMNAILTQNDRLGLTPSYINSKWTDLTFLWYYNPTFELVNGVKTQVNVPSTSFKGKNMMNSPPWNMNLTYDHVFNLPDGGTIKAGLSVKYKTEYDLTWRTVDRPLNHQEAYHMEDVNLIYNSADGKWSLTGYVKNLENYAEKRSLLNMAGSKLLTIGNPRTFGGILSVKF
jgi:iron complex outermembrane recepter protein